MDAIDAKKRRQAALNAVLAVAEAIRELKETPSGPLYAALMAKLSYEDYEATIQILVNAKLVRRGHDHMLTWIGPAAGLGAFNA